MNYPIWTIPEIGGGFLVAMIAVFHAYIAHLAVGGGFLLVITERKAHRSKDSGLMAYVKAHTRAFLLITMVAGGMTGVGIWFIISLVSPAATSTLIHAFVFGWAIEWVFFILEIVALLLYYYFFDRVDRKTHLMLGWIYALSAWASLLIINGILSFMLTPGDWLATKSFWDGFFNPTFWPSLVFRTGVALVIAGIFGALTAVFSSMDARKRTSLLRYLSLWMLLPFVLVALGGYWYWESLPVTIRDTILTRLPYAEGYMQMFCVGSMAVFVGGLVALAARPLALVRPAVVVITLVGLFWLGGFEYMREIARKPYIISGYMYSNSILVDGADKLNETGYLASARWAQHKEITPKNKLLAGRELFVHQCTSCHTVGRSNNIMPLTKKFSAFGMTAQLAGQGKVAKYMPPFFGTQAEREALASYIVRVLHNKEPEEPEPIERNADAPEIASFDKEKDEYALFAFNDLGMHCISDNDAYFVILPPANSLMAQVVKRGETPKVVHEGIHLDYKVQEGFENPEKHVMFWDWAKTIFGADLKPGIGLGGRGVNGKMEYSDKHGAYTAELIPVTPYPDGGGHNPYPLVTVTAKDESGKALVSTQAVLPNSTEMGCRNCHGGAWRVQGFTGIGDQTAEDILAVHDRLNGTDLAARQKAGEPMLCQKCHSDPALGSEGDGVRMSLSASIHGFHANYLTSLGKEACASCHPASASGATQCQRGRHTKKNLDCTHCHGPIENHAIGLLKYEDSQKRPTASVLLAGLKPRNGETKEGINPRRPWMNEPDCLNCHKNFQKPVGRDAFNTWTPGPDALFRNRKDDSGLLCSACHGSPHAIYPTNNPYSKDLDNVQALQYQGVAGTIGTQGHCEVCHTAEVTQAGHHPNTL